MRIAIMQPYFIPYAGYFRLFAAVDLFVIYDCVQFTRRGWLHRNKLPTLGGNSDWLTLPLKKAPQDTKIMDLEFADNASENWEERVKRFPLFGDDDIKEPGKKLVSRINDIYGKPVDYITGLLEIVCKELDINFNVMRSSTLNIPPEIKAQKRILTIAEHFKTKTYINSPGGRELYNQDDFKKRGMELYFLPDYKGPMLSILSRMAYDDITMLKNEIMEQL